VVRRLEQAHAGEAPRCGAPQHVLHQPPADPLVLHLRIDGDRADPGDGRALVEEIAAHDPAAEFRHHCIEGGMGEQAGEQAGGRLRGREVAREAVPVRDRVERLVADPAAGLGVVRPAGPQDEVGSGLVRSHRRHPRAVIEPAAGRRLEPDSRAGWDPGRLWDGPLGRWPVSFPHY
jgi:hypothetical protein